MYGHNRPLSVSLPSKPRKEASDAWGVSVTECEGGAHVVITCTGIRHLAISGSALVVVDLSMVDLFCILTHSNRPSTWKTLSHSLPILSRD